MLEEAEHDRKNALVSKMEKKAPVIPSSLDLHGTSSSSSATPTISLQNSYFEAVKVGDVKEVDRLIKMGGIGLINSLEKVRFMKYRITGIAPIFC